MVARLPCLYPLYLLHQLDRLIIWLITTIIMLLLIVDGCSELIDEFDERHLSDVVDVPALENGFDGDALHLTPVIALVDRPISAEKTTPPRLYLVLV